MFFKRAKKDVATEPQPDKPGLFGRLRAGLSKTRHRLGEGVANAVLGKKVIDDALFEELETQLLMADVGVEVTQSIMAELTEQVDRNQLADGEALMNALQQSMQSRLQSVTQPLDIATDKQPYVVLIVGINGAGKTTTIGKLTSQLQSQGKSVLLAAGDTFRAAAIEQLQTWGERNQVPVVAQAQGSDSASVIFDAIASAKAKHIDVVIADTAGRLHTQDHLLDELRKVKRVIQKQDDTAPHEVMLVLDAGTGQNAVRQAQQFNEAVGLTGLTLTKLDGTAKGGVVLALAEQLPIPIRFIGVGEGIEDLQVFDNEAFVQALFGSK